MHAEAVTIRRNRAGRIADLKALTEQLGIGWVEIKRGNIVTLRFGEGTYRVRTLPRLEELLFGWLERHERGDRSWFDLMVAACSVLRDRCADRVKELKRRVRPNPNITEQDVWLAFIVIHQDIACRY